MNDEILITASSFFHTARVAFWWVSLMPLFLHPMAGCRQVRPAKFLEKTP
jgi:hypothetical protein